MHLNAYLHNAQIVLSLYDGRMPFAAWLKNYFKEHKKFGSKDRKHVAHLCYCYFRLGNAFKNYAVEERLKIGVFLCSHQPNKLLAAINEEWNAATTFPLHEKMKKLDVTENVDHIFPFNHALSPEIDVVPFNQSLLLQPKLFLRIRPGKQKKVTALLQENNIEFAIPADDCIALDNSTKADAFLAIDNDVVVQDISSQQVLHGLLKKLPDAPFTAWDCCAASGGKSILLHDTFSKVHITVSDVRESILRNLRARFERAGIKEYTYFIADVAAQNFALQKKFDLVLCDAPCSGSGTWGRTPEQLHFFTEDKMAYYQKLQKSIVLNAGKCVQPNGYFLYITCSVFAKENEEVVTFIEAQLPLKLVNATYYKGYTMQADTLFAAVFQAL